MNRLIKLPILPLCFVLFPIIVLGGLSFAQTTPLTITTPSLPGGTLGSAYSTTNLSASGGTGSYSWGLASGVLPSGLSLAQGVCIAIVGPCQAPVEISGTPTTAGTYTFTIQVTSDKETASKQFTIQVSVGSTKDYGSPPIVVTPNLSFGVLTDKTSYTQNENIIITVRVKNNSSQIATLNFPSSYQTDYVIVGKFRWSGDKVFTQALTSVVLEPSGIKEWSFTHTAVQYKLETGTHTIIGEVVGYGSATVGITIQPPPPADTVIRYFRYVMIDNPNESFIVKMTSFATIQQALNDLNGARRLIVSGILNSGNGGFNSPWSWHLNPATIVLGESFMELCDARPSYIEAHLAEWLGQIYCPWSARVNAVYDTPPTLATSTTIQVQVHALNVRQDAALNAPKVGLVRQGEILKKLEEKGGWVKVQLPSNQTGWVFEQYVTPITAPAIPTPSQKVIVTAWVLNVRAGPGVNNKIITTVQRNNVLEKVEEKGGWIKVILTNGQSGWVYGKFVK